MLQDNDEVNSPPIICL